MGGMNDSVKVLDLLTVYAPVFLILMGLGAGFLGVLSIRAGKREKVLSSQAIMLCTSCYSCKVRCPRKVPVVDVMHGLAHYALALGYKPRVETALFGQKFWDNIYRLGRIDEKDVALRYFLGHKLNRALQLMLENRNMGIGMLRYKRMKVLPERPIKNIKAFRKMMDKAKATKVSLFHGDKGEAR